ncbi:MAG TPA: hypothetical protein VF821_00065, partial [Lentzea sp.]
MKTIRATLLAIALIAMTPAPAHAVSDDDLAFHWAPIHYQDTDSSDYDADYLSTVDFDGDWNTLNNWENQTQLNKLTGASYYSVVETSTHWFLVYSFFHPRDWDDEPDPFGTSTHENDMEGVLLTVRKDSGFGQLEAAVTVAHSDFYSYVPAGSTFRNGAETIDGALLLQNGRPTTRQEALVDRAVVVVVPAPRRVGGVVLAVVAAEGAERGVRLGVVAAGPHPVRRERVDQPVADVAVVAACRHLTGGSGVVGHAVATGEVGAVPAVEAV